MKTELDFIEFRSMIKACPLKKTLAQLVCTFASVCEGALLRCKRLDQCLCLGAYFATNLLFYGVLFFTCGFVFGFTPPCVRDSAVISESEMLRNRYFSENREKSVYAPRRLQIQPCCFD